MTRNQVTQETAEAHTISIKASFLRITPAHSWINSWLTQRKQRVIVDGLASVWVLVKSVVLQGTLLGPLMFLICINDIGVNISSFIR